jgi:hypothetical protein
MSETTQTEMVLFGAPRTLPAMVAAAVNVSTRYLTKKARGNDGKLHTVKDKNGNPVLEKDPEANPIPVSQRIGLHPRKSEEKFDLTDATGGKYVGQALMQFEREARSKLAAEQMAEFQQLIASGAYTWGSSTRNLRNGARGFVIKPVFGGKSLAAAGVDELDAEAKRRGYKLVKDTAHDNGEPEKAETAPEPEKPSAKGKGKEGK